MISIRRILRILLLPGLFLTAVFSVPGCQNDPGADTDGDAFLYLSVRAASNSINQDDWLWEDRVDELRMIAFDSEGNTALNQMLYFPDGFTSQSRAVKMIPGSYDFYFFANENAVSSGFSEALEQIGNLSDFGSDPRFISLGYDPDFQPDGTTAAGRFLMSAVYEGIVVESGGTENRPLPLPLPTATVELVRALAKVELIFQKNVSGSDVPENTITSVRLENVASVYTVPPADTAYTGTTEDSPEGNLTGFDYDSDTIGRVTFYIPEFLVGNGATRYTEISINNTLYPIESDDALEGLVQQRRTVAGLSSNSVIRNYHYIVNVRLNAEGGIQLLVEVEPWDKETYIFIFQGDQQITIPPVYPTDSSVIIPTECGNVEILSVNEYLTDGLQGAYNDVVEWWNVELQGPTIIRGDPPYYCEKKYGEGWRLINSCELLTWLAYCDAAYNVLMSNTWYARDYDMPYYSLPFREEALYLIEKLTGADLSGSTLYDTNNWGDEITDPKINIVDDYFTPGDILLRLMDFPDGWPYTASPNTSEDWYYIEATIQVKAFWYGSGYVSLTDRSNWDKVLYGQFERYDYSSTVSRCVRSVD